MDIIYESCAGIDIHQESVVVCVLHGSLTSTRPKREERRFNTTTRDLEALNHWLKTYHVQAVGMESTGIFWRPVWHALADDFELILANPQRIKNIPGQKTDKRDAHWIAKLTRIDLIPRSFVPNEDIQELRELTRQRKHVVEARNKEKNRAHKILQSSGIKLTSFMKDLFGKSGRQLLDLLVNGERITERVIKDNVFTTLKNKTPQLLDALNGYFSKHHRFMLQQLLTMIDTYDSLIEELEKEINKHLLGYEREFEILDSIPGISAITSSVLIAEMGVDMTQFPSAKHLASWAGLCPGNNESAGKKKSTRIPKGNRYIKKCLTQAAFVASKIKGSHFQTKFKAIQSRRGPQKAVIAIAHDLLKRAYYLLSTNQTYDEYKDKQSALAAS